MLFGKLSDSRDDVGFDDLSLLVRLRGIVWEDRGAEISAVDGVMYGDGEFEASLVSKE